MAEVPPRPLPTVTLSSGLGMQPRLPRFSPETRTAAGGALASLGQTERLLRVNDCEPDLLEFQLIQTAWALDRLARSLVIGGESASAVRGEPANAIDAYFGVYRASQTAEQAASQEAALLARALADLCLASMDVKDKAVEVWAIHAVLADRYGTHVPERLPADAHDSSPWPARPSAPDPSGMYRWRIGHHLYFWFNLQAARALHGAVDALTRTADSPSAVRYLDRATICVQGFTAAMQHASALPAHCYQQSIRPSMAPPHCPVALTGRMHPDHRTFRRMVNALLTAVPEPHARLSPRAPGLAAARTALLEADLTDIERHVLIAHALVEQDFSLVQHVDGKSAASAVATLRQMRHVRAARYGELVKFGDQFPSPVTQARATLSRQEASL